MDHATALRRILLTDTRRHRALQCVRSLSLPDCWVAAGFVRNAVWDDLHGRPPAPLTHDVDVIWFVPEQPDPAIDQQQEAQLRQHDASIDWSVKNQARMHIKNGDPAYHSATDAMRHWPETATAVAVRLTPKDTLDIAAPFGLDDLFGLTLRPTPSFRAARKPVFLDRVRTKAWLDHWPLLRLCDDAT